MRTVENKCEKVGTGSFMRMSKQKKLLVTSRIIFDYLLALKCAPGTDS